MSVRLWNPDDQKPRKLVIFFQAKRDNRFYQMKKIRNILDIDDEDRKQFKEGMIYFVAVIADYRVNVSDFLDKDDDDKDDDDKDDDYDYKEHHFSNNHERWDETDKLYVKWEHKRKKATKPNFFKYNFEKLFKLKRPIKHIGEQKTQGILQLNNQNLTDCLTEIGFDLIDNIRRCIVVSISRSICYGIEQGEKDSWIKYGDSSVLNINIHVKYLLFVQG